MDAENLLKQFAADASTGDVVANFRAGLIGEGVALEGPYGTKRLVYADYTASGRALRQVEEFVAEKVLPYYANSHTEASYCGAHVSRLRASARALIAAETGADADCAVIFCGSGATAGINRFVSLIGIAHIARQAASAEAVPLVLHGPYEHHSNILPWRESGAEIVEIPEGAAGGPDLDALRAALEGARNRPMVVGAFSAASNVTGIVTDVDAVTRLLKAHGALACWDYAGGAPYLPIDMNPGPDVQKDAVFSSPHKFPGGPGASGVLILRTAAVRRALPTWPGGGSVTFVSPWGHDYSGSVIHREEAGTPNVIGDIRAALVFAVKASIGLDRIAARDRELVARAFSVWSKNPRLDILAPNREERLPIFSITVSDGGGRLVHPQLVTRLLSDRYGIQARGGCACAGPYAHRLLRIDEAASMRLRSAIQQGREIEKPGWTRLNLAYLMDDATADYVISSVDELARQAADWTCDYDVDTATGRFNCRLGAAAAPKLETGAEELFV